MVSGMTELHRQRLAPSMAIVAKVRFDLTLASERTSFVLRLANVDGDWMEEMELPFTYPALEQWTLGYSPIIHCAISDFEFPDVGEYAVEMYRGGGLIGGETFIMARE